jgi:carbamoyltransferase
MRILGIYNQHDACAALFDDYKLEAAIAQERPTRRKGDGNGFPDAAVRECLDQGGIGLSEVDVVCLPRTRYPKKYFKLRAHIPFPKAAKDNSHELIRVMVRNFIADPLSALDARAYLADQGLKPKDIYFYNHHLAHALGVLFHTQWDDALIYTSDGGGDRTFYSARRLKDGRLEEIFGGEADSRAYSRPQNRGDSMGHLYYHATRALGFKPLRHEGKVLGLAAFGKPIYAAELRMFYRVEADGQIRGVFHPREVVAKIETIARTGKREDVAASVQAVLEEITLSALEKIIARHPARCLGLCGGVFANVKLTQRIAERFPFDEIFVYPAMSDQGEAAGGVLEYLLQRDGLDAWLGHRTPFSDVYLGRDYTDGADDVFRAGGAAEEVSVSAGRNDLVPRIAELIAQGKVVGTYLGRGEYGPRALGARSIMAAATDRKINDWLNERLDRTEFMPFAPVVREERCADLFDLPQSLMYTARFMTVTCNVKDEWKDKIPAVVHVDGTARPQVVARATNPLYYDILEQYEQLTGVPALINTSFNVHEEPIINKPEEALKALQMGRVDYVATETALWKMAA